MPSEPYRLFRPKTRVSSVVFASPHSGREYPWSFLKRSVLDELAVRSSEDAFVDLLFSDAPRLGTPLLTATAPRAFVDLNRGPDELDPAVIEGASQVGHNPRVSSGLGVIPRVVSGGRVIYRGKLPMAEAQERLDAYWHPYHAALQDLLAESHAQFGEAILIDCHSMPQEAISPDRDGRRADVVLGDRFGAAAGREVTERIEAAFAAAGLRVARNTPFAGAYITQHYGRPSRGQHVVQVEINRALYLNESRVRPNGRFDDMRRLISGIMAEIVDIGRAETPLAAE